MKTPERAQKPPISFPECETKLFSFLQHMLLLYSLSEIFLSVRKLTQKSGRVEVIAYCSDGHQAPPNFLGEMD